MKLFSSLHFAVLIFFSTSLFLGPKSAIAVPVPTVQLAQSQNQLTEEKVRQTMAAIKQAESQEDVETLIRFLVPYAVSEITVESQGKSTTRSLEGLEAHREMLKTVFEKIKNRETLNEYLTVRLTDDGQLAIVTRINTEKLTTTTGKQFISSGTDIFRVAWIDNQAKVVSTKSQGWIEERPVSK